VLSGAVCASACFLAFAAGEQKFAGEGALIGVHKAADKGGVETKQSSAATVLMAQFTKELGVPSSIIARMVATPPAQVVWLDQRDLHSMGVRTLGVSVQPAQIARETVIVVQKPAADAAAMILARLGMNLSRGPLRFQPNRMRAMLSFGTRAIPN
jgi:hypothetical protein